MGTLSKAVIVAAALLSLAACATNDREAVETYEREQVGEVRRVEDARIVSLEPVDIEGNDLNVGAVVGAIAGGLAGRQVGGGTGQDIMTVVGAVAGGYAGSEIQEGMVRADGVRIGLKMDDGREISLIQELEENERFQVGERVSVVFHGDEAHVEH